MPVIEITLNSLSCETPCSAGHLPLLPLAAGLDCPYSKLPPSLWRLGFPYSTKPASLSCPCHSNPGLLLLYLWHELSVPPPQPLTSNSQPSHLHLSPGHLLCLRFPGTIPCSCFLPQIISAFVFLPLAVCEAQDITGSRPLACALFYAQSHFCQATHWSFKPVTTTSPAGL